MALDKDSKLFKNKSLSDLMSDIYENSKVKKGQINSLIAELQPLMKNAADATVLVPLIKEYLEISVKNDEQLVKLAAIVQRMISSVQQGGPESEFTFSESELKELTTEIDSINTAKKQADDNLSKAKDSGVK